MEKQNSESKTFKDKINEINDKVLEEQKKGKEKIYKEAEKDEEIQTISFGDLLLDGIVNSVSNVASNSMFMKMIDELLTNCHVSKETIECMMGLTNIIVTQVVYTSILLYDDLLKDEIQKQLDHIGNHINLSKADIEALKAVVQIHSKDLSQIKESLEVDKFKKENGIN